MDPPPNRATASSVQYVGHRNPSSTIDFNRRARESGIVDLTANSVSKRRSASGAAFSVPQGKRRKRVHTTNQSTEARKLQMKWGEGTFRWVHKGMYINGPQMGQLCVHKEFKTGSVFEDHFFDDDLLAVDKTAEIIEGFNAIPRPPSTPDGNKMIYLNRPKVWRRAKVDSDGRRRKCLVEPMIEGDFLKFNSNSGFTDGADYMQALSHYSYYHSGGRHLLCDLQGGHYEDAYVLTDPVVMSADNSKRFGSGDLGREGIDNFFAHHRCNRFCQGNWTKPTNPQRSSRIPRASSTSLSLTLGTVKSEADRKKALAAILKRNR